MAIPGVITTIKDRFYSVSRQDAIAGPRIVTIAKRSTPDGTGGVADLDVYRVTNEADVITAFGEGSDLHKAFLELILAGAERVYAVPLPSNTVFTASTGAVTSGGVDIFDAAFRAAESAIPDLIIPWGRGGSSGEWAATPSNPAAELGFYADNSMVALNNWAYKCAQQAKQISENVNPCIAILGVKPFASTNERMTPAQVSSHLALPNLPHPDSNELFKDVGPYVSVIATEVKPVNYQYGYANGAAALAATISRIQTYAAVVNKPVYNIETVRYAPTRYQQTALSDKAVNSIIVNFNKVPVFGEGLTFAQTGSDYVRLSTKRIVDEAALVIRQVCTPFIGEPSNIQTRNAMETAITSGLRGMQLVGALLGSDFTVSYLPRENKAIVDLVLTPAFELKTIEVQVAISI